MRVEQLIEYLQSYPNKEDSVQILLPGYSTLTVGAARAEKWECSDSTFLCLLSDGSAAGLNDEGVTDGIRTRWQRHQGE